MDNAYRDWIKAEGLYKGLLACKEATAKEIEEGRQSEEKAYRDYVQLRFKLNQN